jgi:ABC-type glycerol-3-phosphate transport system substrate-binding protein
MISPGDKLTSFLTGATIALVLSMLAIPFSFAITITSEKRQVTLTAMLEDQGDAKRWNLLLVPALEELRARHRDMDIQLNFTTLPYAQARVQMLKALTNQTPIDLISVDQIWLGEFAQSGLLANLTDKAIVWGRGEEWYQSNWGAVYTTAVSTEYGHGQMLEEYGIGRIY